MARYPIYIRVDPCPRFLKVLAGGVAFVFLCKCAGDFLADTAMVYASDILHVWGHFLR